MADILAEINYWRGEAQQFKEQRDALAEACRYLLSFVPPWAKEAPGGLCATMYGTGTQAGDTEVVARVQEIQALARLDGEETPGD